MSATRYQAYVGTAGGSIALPFTVDGAVQDLTGLTPVEIHFEKPGGATSDDSAPWTDGVVVTDLTNGIVTKTWAADDLDEPSIEDVAGADDRHWRLQIRAGGIFSDFIELRVAAPIATSAGVSPGVYNGPFSIVVHPGADADERIAAAIERFDDPDMGGDIILLAGEYTFGAVVPVPAHIKIAGQGRRTVLVPDFSGTPDSRANALFLAQSTIAASGTTLAAHVERGADAIVVTAVPSGWVPGCVVRVIGCNTATDANTDSGPVTGEGLVELLFVSEDWDGVATTVQLDAPVEQFHQSTTPVRLVTTLVEDVELHDFEIDAAGGSLGDGVHFGSVVGAVARGIRMKGAARAVVECSQGTRSFELRDLRHRGENNQIVNLDSAMHGVVSGIRCDEKAARFHALGTPRGLVTLRNRTTGVKVLDCELARGCQGIRLWGGTHVSFAHIRIHDLNAQEMVDRAATLDELGEIHPAGRIGVAIEGSHHTPSLLTEYSHDVTFDDVHIEDIDTAAVFPGAGYAHAVRLQDSHEVTLTNFKVVNRTGAAFRGVEVNDVQGLKMIGFVLEGLTDGLTIEDFARSCKFSQGQIAPQLGDALVAPFFGLTLRTQTHNATEFSSILLAYENSIDFSQIGVNDYLCRFFNCRVGQIRVGRGFLARKHTASATLSPGDVVDLMAGSAELDRTVTRSTGPSVGMQLVVVGGQSDTYTGTQVLVVAEIQGSTPRTSAPVSAGQPLVGSATPGRLEPDDTPADPLYVKARSTETIALAGLCEAGA